ncbi:DNA polymerase III subunit delta [Candidatus Riflebacteria bacterium]
MKEKEQMAVKLDDLYEKVPGLKFTKAICLAGKEGFLKKLFITEVIAEYRKTHPEGMVYRLNPGNIALRPINLYQQDLFGVMNFRFFVVENLGGISAKARKELYKLAQSLDLNRDLIFFTCQKIGIDKEVQTNLKGKVDVVQVWHLSPYLISEWVQKRIRLLNKNCAPSLCKEIAENCNYKLELIYSTIKKLCAYLGEQKKVSTDVVQLLCKRTAKKELYHLGPCLGNRDCSATFNFTHQLLAQKGIKPLNLFYLLANFFKGLCLIKSFLEDIPNTCYPIKQMARNFAAIDGKSDYKSNIKRKNITTKLENFLATLKHPPVTLLKKYRVYQLLEYVGYAEKYKLNELESILMLLKDFDVRLKYHPGTGENLFFHLLTEIFSSISAIK